MYVVNWANHQQAYRYVVMLLIIAVILRFRFRREISHPKVRFSEIS